GEAHRRLDTVGEEGDGGVAGRVDAETGGCEQSLELGVTTRLPQVFPVETAVVRNADGRPLEDGAEPGGRPEQTLGGVEDPHEHAGPVEGGGHARQGVEEVGDRGGSEVGSAGEGEGGAVGEQGQLDRVQGPGIATDGEGTDDPVTDPQALADGTRGPARLRAPGQAA